MTTLLDDLETTGTIAALDAIDEIKRMQITIDRLRDLIWRNCDPMDMTDTDAALVATCDPELKD